MDNDSLSPASLAAVPEVREARKAVMVWFECDCPVGVICPAEYELDRFEVALRDAVLAAHRDALLKLTPERVVEAAVERAIEAGRGATRLSHSHSERTYLTAGIRAALPVLLAPEVAKREQVERERDEAVDALVAAATERDRLKGALEKLAHPSEGACPICAARAALEAK